MTADVIAPGDRREVVITGIASEGDGVGRLPGGRAIFVPRTAPGDRIEVEVTAVKKRWARGEVERVVEPAPERVEPPCPFFDRCGGCALQHLAYPAQLEAKRRMVLDALERIGDRSAAPEPELHPATRELGYRNRVSLHLRRLASGRVVSGFRDRSNPRHVVDVEGRCLLPEESVGRVWRELREHWGEAARHLPEGRDLRLTLRGTAEGEVTLLVEGGHGDGEPELLVRGVEGLSAIWLAAKEGEPPRLAAGVEAIEEEWLGERLPVRPGAFVQVNREGAEQLHRVVVEELGAATDRRVLDAYCGHGGYGRAVARAGAHVVGIEADPEAVRMGSELRVEGFTLLEGRVEERLDDALPVDLAVLNPPRTGVEDGVMERLAASAPERIVYVSCDPATLARDLGRLGKEYRIARLAILDLFPQTAHVETVVTLERAGER